MNPFDPGYYETPELRTFGFANIGENVRIAKNCTIIGPENISIGDNSPIDGFCTIVANTGSLRVGRSTHIHIGCVIGARGVITIGDYATISHHCRVLSASDDFSGEWMTNSVVPPEFTKPLVEPIHLADHVALGCNVTILPGQRCLRTLPRCGFGVQMDYCRRNASPTRQAAQDGASGTIAGARPNHRPIGRRANELLKSRILDHLFASEGGQLSSRRCAVIW